MHLLIRTAILVEKELEGRNAHKVDELWTVELHTSNFMNSIVDIVNHIQRRLKMSGLHKKRMLIACYNEVINSIS
jgi:hypothetical protein